MLIWKVSKDNDKLKMTNLLNEVIIALKMSKYLQSDHWSLERVFEKIKLKTSCKGIGDTNYFPRGEHKLYRVIAKQ